MKKQNSVMDPDPVRSVPFIRGFSYFFKLLLLDVLTQTSTFFHLIISLNLWEAFKGFWKCPRSQCQRWHWVHMVNHYTDIMST